MNRRDGLVDQLTESELWQLASQYPFGLRRSQRVQQAGQKRNTQSRMGRDFHGYVSYRAGEDVRHVDWPVFARTGNLFVRRYEDESFGRIMLVVDASGSMGLNDGTKWLWSRQLATVLGFAALQDGHQVIVAICQDSQLFFSRPFHGQNCAADLYSYLSATQPTGAADLSKAVQAINAPAEYGRIVFLSDFMTDTQQGARLSWLVGLAGRCALVRILEPNELRVKMEQISDPESSQRHVFAHGERRLFQSRLNDFERAFHQAVGRLGVALVDLQTAGDFQAACTLMMAQFTTGKTQPQAV
ncbi:MAG: hypothetical protein CMH52_07855 [Myxococcales bacterium]|nr:hypothetical protein [Myxococcales bacterium]